MPEYQQDVQCESTERFLRLLLRGRWDPSALQVASVLSLQGEIDWDALRHVARHEGLIPLLYAVVRDRALVPPPVEQALSIAYYRTARRNLLLFRELEAILRCLTAEGVEVLVLKGAALAEAVYGNVSVRSMEDLDLLVRQGDVLTTLRILSSRGYERPYPELCPGYTLMYWNQIKLVKPGAEGTPIEVHWHLLHLHYYQHVIPMDWFWQTALPIRIGDASAWMLGPEAQVLHLCGHMLQHGGLRKARSIWLHDVAEVTYHYREQIEWDQVLTRAQAYGLALPVREILAQVGKEWRAPIPATALERLRALRPTPGEERIYALYSAPHRPMQRLWAGLAMIPCWRARLRFVWCHLFPSADYMQHRHRIPLRLLVPLYYPLRWLWSLRRVR